MEKHLKQSHALIRKLEGFAVTNRYIEKIHKVIDYISENTNKQISVKELADLAGFSQYHFHRIFTAYTGEPLSSFVKRVRLEKSASCLIYADTNITEVALTYGYDTPSAYTKAFKQLFGVNPSKYKTIKSNIIAVEKESEEHNQRRRIIMENFIGIKDLGNLKVISVRKTGKYSDSANEAWNSLCKFAYSKSVGQSDKIITPESKFIGIGYDNPCVTAEENLRYEACITVDKDIQTEGEVFKNEIPGGKYAVFLHKGPYDSLMQTYNAIFTEWLPNNPYKLRDLPCFEMYLNRNPKMTKPENLRTEIYIPLE